MKFGIVGCGKMGFAIADRVVKAGFEVIAFDLDQQNLEKVQAICCTVAASLQELAQACDVIWLMVPQGKPVDDVLEQILEHSKNKIIIDGGNSHFSDSIRRSIALQAQDISFLDCGTSGGLHGHVVGFSLMIGGDKFAFERAEPFFKVIAAPHGYAYLGNSGAGHYVKMVHNGIEYALLEAYAEGFNLLKNGSYKDLDLAQVANVWENGSIIRSWIGTLSRQVLEKDQNFDAISGSIAENLTGRWTLDEAKVNKIPVDLIEQSLEIRSWSRATGGDWRTKMVAMLRNAFGGHDVHKK